MTTGTAAGGLITVFGGSGFVGRYIVRALAKKGWRVRAACRRPDLAGHLQPMGAVGQIHAVQANLRYPDSVRAAVQGADAVVNCVGILAESGRQSFRKLQDEGARAVAKACREAGAKQLVHLSAIGADARASARYARTKGEGERAVLEEFPDAVILRPSIVFGPEDDFFNRFAAMAQVSPLLPLIGGGRTRFQPVYVGDVAAAAVIAIEGGAKPGTIYELGGPETLSFRELLDRTQDYAGRHRAYLGMPFWMAKMQAVATMPLALVANTLRPVTLDQVKMLERDNVVSELAQKEGRTLKGLGIATPHAVGTIVPGYLERFQPKGQFAHYRR
ncbi:MAG: complex I NDUFA9 subunit family protein [Hyphomicrobium sp.]|nr:complex I NDUFA9 subunit family protein [Hyphomicrobium sp.]